MYVTAADSHLQQSLCATTLLTPALLPIGGGRHKMLTGSMRFLRNPPTGNHSRGQERERYEGSWRSRDAMRRMWSLFKADILFSFFFCLLGSCEKEVREEPKADTTTNNVCSDIHSNTVDVSAGVPRLLPLL